MTEKQLQKQREKEEKAAAKLRQEIERTEAMMSYERRFSDREYICGIDEVGRGPLAGPVVACAEIRAKGEQILYLNDSKKLPEKKRNMLFDVIMEKAVSVRIRIIPPTRIDEINILKETYEAMREAIGRLAVRPDILLNDAVTIPDVPIAQVPIIGGDGKSVSIAAASIVAKVTRDRMMVEYAEKFPGYAFEKNKGYGTAAHIEGLKKYGPCEIHRRTFIGHFVDV